MEEESCCTISEWLLSWFRVSLLSDRKEAVFGALRSSSAFTLAECGEIGWEDGLVISRYLDMNELMHGLRLFSCRDLGDTKHWGTPSCFRI